MNYIGIEADYYIYAQRNGWEYGNTINYRANIGKAVQVPNPPTEQELAESPGKFLYSARLIHGHLTKAALVPGAMIQQPNQTVKDTVTIKFMAFHAHRLEMIRLLLYWGLFVLLLGRVNLAATTQ